MTYFITFRICFSRSGDFVAKPAAVPCALSLRSPRTQAFCGTGSSQALFLPVFRFGHPERGAAAHRTLAVLLRASRRLSETDFDAQ
ncbi:hypothetical protein ACWC9U_38320 [Streptomyces sp. 900116325]